METRKWIGGGMLVIGAVLVYAVDFLQRKTPKAERNLWWKLPGALMALGGALVVFI